jgi:hypothetical protein
MGQPFIRMEKPRNNKQQLAQQAGTRRLAESPGIRGLAKQQKQSFPSCWLAQ